MQSSGELPSHHELAYFSTPGLGEDQQQMILRSIVLSYGGGHGNIEEVIEEASRQFNEYLEDEQASVSTCIENAEVEQHSKVSFLREKLCIPTYLHWSTVWLSSCVGFS